MQTECFRKLIAGYLKLMENLLFYILSVITHSHVVPNRDFGSSSFLGELTL